jgi:hypothetical protein
MLDCVCTDDRGRNFLRNICKYLPITRRHIPFQVPFNSALKLSKQLDRANSDLSSRVGPSDWSASFFHPDLSELVTTIRINFIKRRFSRKVEIQNKGFEMSHPPLYLSYNVLCRQKTTLFRKWYVEYLYYQLHVSASTLAIIWLT